VLIMVLVSSVVDARYIVVPIVQPWWLVTEVLQVQGVRQTMQRTIKGDESTLG
jgi:hypothetical protein